MRLKLTRGLDIKVLAPGLVWEDMTKHPSIGDYKRQTPKRVLEADLV